jgi:SAM-dependent methyltransferase
LETIEHLEKDHEFLTEVHRVLRPGGTFICSTPNRTVTNPGKELFDRPWNPFHIREYSEKEFFHLLRAKFESVTIYGQNPKKRWKVNFLEKIGKVLPFHGVVRINQVIKLPHLTLDKVEDHLVLNTKGDHDYEYLVAVCH